MRLATIRDGGTTRAVRIEGDEAIVLDAPDVRAALERGDVGETGPRLPVAALDYTPLIPSPDKIICVGLNYRSHIEESGLEQPSHPALFTKFHGALVGANDNVLLPYESRSLRLGGRAHRRRRLAGAPRVGRAGRRAHRRLHDHERLQRPRLAAAHVTVARRQVVGARLAVGSVVGDEGRVARAVERDHLRDRRRGEAEVRHR